MTEEPIAVDIHPDAIPELIERRKWSEAVDALRRRLLDGRAPSVQGRLQLADLMVSAGREREAVPILLGLADELVGERSLAKAVAVLKRVDRIEPGRADVQRRLEDLVHTQSELAPRLPQGELDDRPAEEAPIGAATGADRTPAAGEAQPSAGPSGAEEHLRGVLREFLGLDVGDVTLPPGRIKANDILAKATAARTDRPERSAEASSNEGAMLAGTARDTNAEEEILDLVADVLRLPSHGDVHAGDAQSEAARVSRLLAVPLFSKLSAAELLAVVQGLALRTFEPGDVLVTEGEPGRSLFVLTSGRARVFVRSRDGHAVEVGRLDEGDFFGEIAALSGARRGATVTAASPCEVLELEKATLDTIALAHPRVRATIEETYIARAGDPAVAGVRQARLAARQAPARSVEVLAARFGEGHWDPRMRLELADALLRSDKHDEAVPILVGLADELARHGRIAKAIALVKKVERIQNRHVEVLPLAPLAASAPSTAAPVVEDVAEAAAMDPFERWVLRLAREGLAGRTGARSVGGATSLPAGYHPGLRASPLFESLSEEDLLRLVAGLRLVSRQAGDVVVSEGEPGEGLFVLAAGTVKVMVRDQNGRSATVCRLEEGAFFGEIAALSGAPRSATVVTAAPCELLELDRKALDSIAAEHPRVKEALEQASAQRSQDPVSERLRAR